MFVRDVHLPPIVLGLLGVMPDVIFLFLAFLYYVSHYLESVNSQSESVYSN